MSYSKEKLQQRLQQLQNRGNKSTKNFEERDWSKVFFKPQLGKQVIRLVPNKYNKEFPYTDVYFHKNIIKNQMYALTNWGEKDPIVELAQKLKKSKDKEDWTLAKKLSPKKRCFAQVVIRGKENEGTKLWEFGPTVEEQLMRIYNDDEYGDISDIQEGTDLTIEGFSATFPGKDGKDVPYIKPTINPKRDTSPLADNAEMITKLLDEQQDPLQLYKKWSFDELKDFLQQWMSPADSEEEQPNATPIAGQVEITHEDLPFEVESSAPIEEKPKNSKRDQVNKMFSNKK